MNYFVRNPRAADSVEGVARWRLLDQAIHRTVDETHRALEWLVAEGFLCRATTPGGGTIFTLNTERQTEARSFLESGPGGAGGPEDGIRVTPPGKVDDHGGREH